MRSRLAALLLASDAAEATGRLIAVLLLDVRMAKSKMDDADQASLEEMLRDVAVNAPSSEGWTVLTGETTIQILADNGIDAMKCGDQNCRGLARLDAFPLDQRVNRRRAWW